MDYLRHNLLTRALFIACVSMVMVTASAWAQTAPPTSAGQLTNLLIKVQNAAGEKLPGVEVVFLSEEVGVVLKGKTVEGGSLRLRTDANGRFTLPSATNLFAVIANDDGFVLMQSADFTNHPFMTVQPWGRLEGIRLNRGKPVSDLWVRYDLHPRFLASDEQYYLLEDLFVIAEDAAFTDREGKFSFPVVPPGQISLRESPKPLVKKLFFFRGSFAVAPGKSGQTTISSEGVGIKGRVVLGKGLTNKGVTNAVLRLLPTEYANKDIEPPPLPATEDHFGKRAVWWGKWLAAAEGQRRAEMLARRNALQMMPDGSLVGEMVPPGRYQIQASIYDTKKKIAYVDQAIVIPKSALNDANQQPYDIGEVLVKPVLGPGDVAPDFTVKKFEGGSLKLSELRGQYVLLDFWATWCGPCVEELPRLQAVHGRFGKDARFAMVSLSLDSDVQELRDFLRKNKLPWQQVILGDWDEDQVTKSYGFSSIPQILLIDPEGKVVAAGLRGDDIEAAVKSVLEK
jgi:thiol-disulfide isomerase/thioredoxin